MYVISMMMTLTIKPGNCHQLFGDIIWWMDGLDAATSQCNHPATVTSSFGEDCCK
jgi:hypothetical protein